MKSINGRARSGFGSRWAQKGVDFAAKTPTVISSAAIRRRRTTPVFPPNRPPSLLLVEQSDYELALEQSPSHDSLRLNCASRTATSNLLLPSHTSCVSI